MRFLGLGLDVEAEQMAFALGERINPQPRISVVLPGRSASSRTSRWRRKAQIFDRDADQTRSCLRLRWPAVGHQNNPRWRVDREQRQPRAIPRLENAGVIVHLN